MEESWPPDKSELTETDAKVLADIERYGWHCLHVRGAEGEAELPTWSFSIGVFRTWRHPELVVFGLGEDVKHRLLAQLVERIEQGERLEPGRDYEDVLEGYRCRLVRVDPKWYSSFLGYAQWFYEDPADFPVLQLVWPDRDGRYPWEDGYAVTAGVQPVLLSDDEAGALGWT